MTLFPKKLKKPMAFFGSYMRVAKTMSASFATNVFNEAVDMFEFVGSVRVNHDYDVAFGGFHASSECNAVALSGFNDESAGLFF